MLRKKRALHPAAFPSLAVAYCLEAAHITPEELDAVVVCSSTGVKNAQEDVYLNSQLRVIHNNINVYTIPHHLGHAVAVYALSGFEKSSILIVDGSGSPWNELTPGEIAVIAPADLEAIRDSPGRLTWRETISLYSADRGRIQPLEKHISTYGAVHNTDTSKSPPQPGDDTWVGMLQFESLGDMFGAVGRQIFGSFYDGPGKVMGLAPFGKPSIPVDEFYRLKSGRFEFVPEICKRFPYTERWPEHQHEYEDLAASVQQALEKAVLHLCSKFESRSYLCFAGGVALNSVANERIVREAGFDQVFIMPAAEDSGTAIGAAYYGLWQICGYMPIAQQAIDEAGRPYSNAEIASVIERTPGVALSHPLDVIEQAAELLSRGKIVGWFQGGSELGPRALGQRSILCDPRRPDMKDVLNSRVKFREGFRPFAPVVRQEDVCEWFDVPPKHNHSPFMLRVMPFREEKQSLLPAVVHIDGTGRVQTVAKDTAPRLHQLLTAFYNRTRVPMLLNTSFNVAGEPIVETPKDAVSCFLYTGMDCCILEDHLISKLPDVDPLLSFPLKLLSKWALLSCRVDKTTGEFDTPRVEDSILIDSAQISRAAEMDVAIHRSYQPHIKLITRTPWGLASHILPSKMAHILRLVDGQRSGKDIFDQLLASGAMNRELSISDFRKQLALLSRVGAIWFNIATRAAELKLARTA